MSYSSKIGIRWPVATIAQFFPSSAWLSLLWLNEINWTPCLADTPPTAFTLWSFRFFLQMEILFPRYRKSSTISFTLQNFIRLLVNLEIQQRTSSLRNQHENFLLPFFKNFEKKRKICYNYVLYFRIPSTLLVFAYAMPLACEDSWQKCCTASLCKIHVFVSSFQRIRKFSAEDKIVAKGRLFVNKGKR